jgi:ubiquinone/menaquinone biosynthesis C-methylase UbiE
LWHKLSNEVADRTVETQGFCLKNFSAPTEECSRRRAGESPATSSLPAHRAGLTAPPWQQVAADFLRYGARAMGRNRRNVRIDDDAAWIFNRMADVYDARPPYPAALVDSIAEMASHAGSRLIDIGAGIGHLALPIARRGLDVVAVEPARSMLARLQSEAARQGLKLRALHAAAEALPFEVPSFDCALIADALHFLDAELAATELRRVLVPHATLILVTCGFTPTQFMREVQRLVGQSADRRQRDVTQAIRHLASLAEVQLTQEAIFYDETPVDVARLERILGSVSFVGPAMKGARFATLRDRVKAIPYPTVWARTFRLRSGQRRPLFRLGN